MRNTIKRTAVVGVTLGATLSAGLAFAAWTATGGGNGSAGATSAKDLVVAASTASGQLFPGGSGDLKLTVQNPNGYNVTLSSVSQTAGASITVDSAHSACNVAEVTFDGAAGLTQVVTAGATAVAVDGLTGKVKMSKDAIDACQGAVFTIPVTLTGLSS